ncbi:hypothetical protein SAMN05444000_1187 [Shimia gijangensis]|uniref:Uncharacterized protein n=1 Tax=Shimia gijangensis TaxID=1470563 RepID=A0A1M6PD57_9RHOB|nr:hypothetical protein [Shimia gijangensis]SHK05898.1 hypothetical protein SAMN05444000_1187 [Shimia gijangensis]
MIRFLTTVTVVGLCATGLSADDSHAIHQGGAIAPEAKTAKVASFDILAAHVHRAGNMVSFHMTTNGAAGSDTPEAKGSVGGAPVWSYVWPTSLDPSVVGFDEGAGILAMAATSHPDFDDTPLFDENLDGSTGNDGGIWHSHWVVLAPTEACGSGSLAVKDIPEGATPNLPLTWPGFPILLDSPGFTPVFDGPEVTINAAVAGGAHGASYDGVTAALRVNESVHAPLLCVTDVFDVASADLSLPGRVE